MSFLKNPWSIFLGLPIPLSKSKIEALGPAADSYFCPYLSEFVVLYLP